MVQIFLNSAATAYSASNVVFNITNSSNNFPFMPLATAATVTNCTFWLIGIPNFVLSSPKKDRLEEMQQKMKLLEESLRGLQINEPQKELVEQKSDDESPIHVEPLRRSLTVNVPKPRL